MIEQFGADGRAFCDKSLSQVIRGVLARFDSPDADIVSLVAREDGLLEVGGDDRIEIAELFRWFALGTGI